VAATVLRAEPARLSGRNVISHERAGGGHDDDIVHDQGRTREAPRRYGLAGVGPDVARPHDSAVPGVQGIKDAGRAEGVDAIAAERWSAARTSTAVRLPEADAIAVSPHRLAGGHLIRSDDLVFTSLLLRIDDVAPNREGRPARPDWPAPQLDRRRLGPVGLDPYVVNDGVAIWSAKARPL